jgi:hypothetical protein
MSVYIGYIYKTTNLINGKIYNRRKINEAHERKRQSKMLAKSNLEECSTVVPELHKEVPNEC